MKNYLKRQSLLLIVSTMFVVHAIAAEPQEYTLKLHSLKALQQQEKTKDELYISVTEYTQGQKPNHYQIPSFPSHWLSPYLSNIQDVVLWQKPLQQCENTDLIISLIEEDYPPWNVDDLLGSVRLKIKCENGKMLTQWEIPNASLTTQKQDKKNVFNFIGDNANYQAEFSVNHAKAKPGALNPQPQKVDGLLQQRYMLIP